MLSRICFFQNWICKFRHIHYDSYIQGEVIRLVFSGIFSLRSDLFPLFLLSVTDVVGERLVNINREKLSIQDMKHFIDHIINNLRAHIDIARSSNSAPQFFR